MADIVDRSVQDEEVFLNIHRAHRKEVPPIKHTGYCNYCEEEVASPKLFCDSTCATKYEKQK